MDKITVPEFYRDIAKEFGKAEPGPCNAMQEGQVLYADIKSEKAI